MLMGRRAAAAIKFPEKEKLFFEHCSLPSAFQLDSLGSLIKSFVVLDKFVESFRKPVGDVDLTFRWVAKLTENYLNSVVSRVGRLLAMRKETKGQSSDVFRGLPQFYLIAFAIKLSIVMMNE